jgi:hypothetical protein
LLSSCGVKIQTSAIKYAEVPEKISSLVVCRAVGGNLNLNKRISQLIENEIRIHLDTMISNEQVTELLQENNIFYYEDYTDILLKKISNLTNQRFLIVPTIEAYRESQNIDVQAYLTISYLLYDATDKKALLVVKSTAKDSPIKNSNFQSPTDINSKIPLFTKEVVEKIFNYIGISYNKEATYKRISLEEYEKNYLPKLKDN